MEVKATKILRNENPSIVQAVYECTPPYLENRFVLISSVCARDRRGVPETYAFPCDESGDVTDWTELPCSIVGVHNHEPVIARIKASV